MNPKLVTVIKTSFYNVTLVIFFLLFILTFVFSLNLLTKGIHILTNTSTQKMFVFEKNQSYSTLGVIVGETSTAVSQSQSVTTSIVVSMVAGNAITVTTALPLAMGGNIGTSIASTLIAGAMYHGDIIRYRRAFAAAVLSDVLNIMTVFVVFPLEYVTHALEKLTREIVNYDKNHHNRYHTNMRKAKALIKDEEDNFNILFLVQPLMHRIVQLNDYNHMNLTGKALRNCTSWNRSNTKQCSYFLEDWYDVGNDVGIGLILCVSSIFLLGIVLAVFAAVTNKVLRSPMEQRVKAFRSRAGSKENRPLKNTIISGIAFGLFGFIIRCFLQSSLVFVAIITSLCAGQYISFPNTYALVLGGNIGATSTTLLAALSQRSNEIDCVLQVFLFHLFFTVISVLLYSLPRLQFPLYISKVLGEQAAVYKWFPYFYLICVFIIAPGVTTILYIIHPRLFFSVIIILTIIIFSVMFISKLQEFRNGTLLPRFLTTWNFLPMWMHSLDPLDKLIRKLPFGGRNREASQDKTRAEFSKEKDLVKIDIKHNNENDTEEV